MLSGNVVASKQQLRYPVFVGVQRFDVKAFHAALDGVRQSRAMTWRQVARETGISASSLTSMAQGSRPDIDTVASLAAGANLDPATFFPKNNEQSSLSMVTAYIHRDPSLSPEAASALEQVVRATYSQLARGTDSRERPRK